MTADPAGHDAEQLIQAFTADRPTFETLREEVEYMLTTAVGEAGLKTDRIESRVKAPNSFRDKLRRKDYTDPLTDMPDIVGARVVCLFPSDLGIVDSIIRDTFDVLQCDDKAKESPPEMWRYVSVHYDCVIKGEHRGPRYDRIKNRVFEIQVRTILQHAWSTVEHYLAYKGANSIPSELRRDFSALVGLFHVADKSFQQIYNTSIELDEQARRNVHVLKLDSGDTFEPRATTDWLPIDRSTVKALCRELYPDWEPSPDSAYSEFAEELAGVGINRISQLETQLRKGRTEAESEGQQNSLRTFLDGTGESRYRDVELARKTLMLTVPRFRDQAKRRMEQNQSSKKFKRLGRPRRT
ncbi:GTP pyrophosphokinase [Mycolicibacterium gadium]|uniref:RelA/SpoT domain-containing protein n=1 Tax=Mycolicibacterium gadium TaxID=1794 RepID=A0A7I7WY77_MYCGU|nr:hypothetical protein [Mycolicibacterium gadium]BBZ20878.1 hypothetical protein MGAD_52130 [Mycolicibacterium gadium]